MAFFAAALWGIWWIPIRYLETLGLDGAWGSVAMNAGAGLAALVWMLAMRVPFQVSRRGVMGAVLVAVAVTTYSVALTLADVVRVILLFYLAPAGGKLLEWAFLGHRWGWSSTIAIVASLSGAYLVLGGEVSLAEIGLGDMLAVLSGVAWAGGAALIFTGGRAHPMSLSLVTACAAALIGIGFIVLGSGTVVSGDMTAKGMGVGAAAGILYVLPILALTLWSAQRLSPAVVSFLLTAEILSGVLSGVLFLDEPFGAMQAAGAVLILFAAAVEVIPVILRKAA